MKLLAVIVFILAILAATALGKDKDDRPRDCVGTSAEQTTEACYTLAVHEGSILKSHMKYPDTFTLLKVAATSTGDLCFRYTAENSMGQKVNSVALWFQQRQKALHMGWVTNPPPGIENHRIGRDEFYDHAEDYPFLTQRCSDAIPLQVEKVRAGISNSAARSDF